MFDSAYSMGGGTRPIRRNLPTMDWDWIPHFAKTRLLQLALHDHERIYLYYSNVSFLVLSFKKSILLKQITFYESTMFLGRIYQIGNNFTTLASERFALSPLQPSAVSIIYENTSELPHLRS